MLYQIKNTNIRLLGTLHLVPPGAAPWKEQVKAAFEWSEQVYVELRAMNHEPIFTGAARLRADALPSDLYAAISRNWIEPSLPALDLCNLVGVTLALTALGLDRVPGVEPLVERWCEDTSKPIFELESPQEFVDSVDGTPLDDFLYSIRYSLSHRSEAQKRFREMYNAWRRHDGRKILELIVRGTTPAMRAGLFGIRNRGWASKIAGMVGDGRRTLVLCGAGHLCGNDSLREILRTSYQLETARLLM